MKRFGKTRLFVTGIDTGIGKTIVSAILTKALDAYYWKPVQCGVTPDTDKQFVSRLTRLADNKFLEEYNKALSLNQPNIEAICISSFDKSKNEPDSRYVNLKYIQEKIIDISWVMKL